MYKSGSRLRVLVCEFFKPLSGNYVHSSTSRYRRRACELGVLRIARLRIDEPSLFSRESVGWDSALDHRREVLVDLVVDLRYRLRMEHSLAKPRAASQPV